MMHTQQVQTMADDFLFENEARSQEDQRPYPLHQQTEIEKENAGTLVIIMRSHRIDAHRSCIFSMQNKFCDC